MNTQALKFLAESDRPREKALASGIRSLTNTELLAILIGSGTIEESALELAQRLLRDVEDDLHLLARLGIENLKEYKGIGAAKAVKIAASLELGRRKQGQSAKPKTRITESGHAFALFAPHLQDLMHEEFWVLFMNRRNQKISVDRLGAGGVHGVIVDPKLIFRKAMQLQATSLIVAHNHPSGTAEPSQEDIRLTRKILEGAKLLDMRLLDHLIIYDQSYYSFRDEGKLV